MHGSGPVSAEMGVSISLISSTDSEDPVLDLEAHLSNYPIPNEDPMLSTCSFEELNAVTPDTVTASTTAHRTSDILLIIP